MTEERKVRMEKVVGVYEDRNSASHVNITVFFVIDHGTERLSLKYKDTQLTVPFHNVMKLADLVRGM